ncbi:arginine--tRNA ligase [Leptospira ognonensis]|uniref:Arginine--tRNA ligase n=1 Tax=Leptospira ognonensis TaxID=2484945 RepID=A0A4R9K384_9LEPT|nr:arginine--tRNA ligase [Leptospira ognonensis]TGL59691.1 arginine--tRNA ligase [Leptospira ognonensis]
MNPQSLIKNRVLHELTAAISATLMEFFPTVELSQLKIRIEYSRDEKFGDYSSPFALENKNALGKNPKDISELLIPNLTKSKMFSDVSFSMPGFINFRIDKQFLWEFILHFLDKDQIYAKVSDPKKICLEFVSANPTGPMNIVSARSAAYGDSLAHLLGSMGHQVQREFYVNDFGNQVNLLGVAVLLRYLEAKGETISFQDEEDDRSVYELIEARILPKESYRGEYIKDIAIAYSQNNKEREDLEKYIQAKNWGEIIERLSVYAVQFNLSRQKDDLKSFGVHFDQFFSERTLHEEGSVDAVSDLLKKDDLRIDEGKLYFLSTKYNDDKDRVIRRDDGRPTYLMADIAYHINKFKRGFDELIDIWGPDHYGYIARLKGALVSFGKPEDSFKVLIAQQVNLIENKEKVKMSKRLGIFQTMNDLLAYLGKNARDVGRYFFLMRSADMPLDFDLDLAKDESDKNPVFYIQYAHARICSINRELGESDLISKSEISKSVDMNLIQSEDRARLLFWIARFPEEVFDAASSLEPHRITNYLQALSKAFTKFYGNKENRIKDKLGMEREMLLLLIACAKIAISHGLALLGISAPEKMSKEESVIT